MAGNFPMPVGISLDESPPTSAPAGRGRHGTCVRPLHSGGAPFPVPHGSYRHAGRCVPDEYCGYRKRETTNGADKLKDVFAYNEYNYSFIFHFNIR